MPRHSFTDRDPLDAVLAPPPNETPEERDKRIAAELEAKRVSDEIDAQLNREREREKKKAPAVRVLLLGQSESGKSTTLKNFQLINSSKAFQRERPTWGNVIRLNVVKAMLLILDILNQLQAGADSEEEDSKRVELTPDLLMLKQRLAPLYQLEESFAALLSPGFRGEKTRSKLRDNVFNINVNSEKFGLSRLWGGGNIRESIDGDRDVVDHTGDDAAGDAQAVAQPRRSNDDPAHVLHMMASDMVALWSHPTVKKLMRVRDLKVGDIDRGGYFMNKLETITDPAYVPTDDDILRARIKTMGVSEHRFRLKTGPMGNLTTSEWRVFDVGGARSMRAAWAPYFDDIDAIIFLAPISCYDEVLEEDPTVNRLEDSMKLWRTICENPLLKNTDLILFLNKCDVMKEKLRVVPFSQHVVSYKGRDDDFEGCANYLKRKFGQVHKSHSPQQRPFYCHMTSVTDTKSTHAILGNVKDLLVRKNLLNSHLV
ncbi:guanine nucleotide binding protein, alpha subunit [Schizophyllum commune Tattone D]|nr:guanine nucleotide binding protein, alpha subunit [Schizophyllum commune Tattone D]